MSFLLSFSNSCSLFIKLFSFLFSSLFEFLLPEIFSLLNSNLFLSFNLSSSLNIPLYNAILYLLSLSHRLFFKCFYLMYLPLLFYLQLFNLILPFFSSLLPHHCSFLIFFIFLFLFLLYVMIHSFFIF